MGISKDVKADLKEVGKISLANWTFEGIKNVELKRGGSLDIYEFSPKDASKYPKLKGECIGLFERDLIVKGNNDDGYEFSVSKRAFENALVRAEERASAVLPSRAAEEAVG